VAVTEQAWRQTCAKRSVEGSVLARQGLQSPLLRISENVWRRAG
jgi:hypothetical protein